MTCLSSSERFEQFWQKWPLAPLEIINSARLGTCRIDVPSIRHFLKLPFLTRVSRNTAQNVSELVSKQLFYAVFGLFWPVFGMFWEVF